MKKALYAAAAVAMLVMSACSGKSCDSKSCPVGGDKDMVYTGVVPAADCAGIRYTLKLDYDDDHNYTDGDYDLVMTYLGSDSTSVTGYKDLSTSKSEGDFKVIDGKDANAGKTYLELTEDAPKGQKGSVTYYLIDSDSTITMVNSDLELPAPGLNYSLKLAR